MGEQTDTLLPTHDPPAADVGKAWIHAARQSGIRACRDLGSSNRPLNRRPGFSPPPPSLHRFMQTTAPARPLTPVSFSNGNEGPFLFAHLAGHFLSDPISLGLSMPNRCRVSESTRVPEPGLECIRPAPGNGGVFLPVRTEAGIPRRRIGHSFDLSKPIILGVLWRGGRCRLSSFLFPHFLVSSRGCVEKAVSPSATTTSIPGPVTPSQFGCGREREAGGKDMAYACWSKLAALPWVTLPFVLLSLPDCLAQPTSSRLPIGGRTGSRREKQTGNTERLDCGGDGCTPRRVAAVALQDRVDCLNLHHDDDDNDGGGPGVSHKVGEARSTRQAFYLKLAQGQRQKDATCLERNTS